MTKIIPLLFAVVLLFIFYSTAYSDSNVKINEILADPQEGQKEWVELYFPQGSFDISAYTLKDKVGTAKSLTTLQTCGNYAVYELTSASGEGWLNNSGEESLFLYDGVGTQVHSLENFTNPGEGKTLGLIPDGSTDLATTQQSTKCAQNSQAAQNSPSPTPLPSPSPSSSPSNSSKSSSPSPKNSPSPSPKSPMPSPKKSPESVLSEKEEIQTAPTPTPTLSPTPSPSPKGETISKTKVAGILTGGGLVIIGASIGFFLWYQRTVKFKEEDKDKQSFSANKQSE